MSDSETFVYTKKMILLSNGLWMITSAVGACMCFIVLVIIGLVSLHPISRPHLDRVSFRIVVYALVANMIFGIVNAIGGSFTGPTWTCGLTIWLLQLTLELASFLTLGVALNLQLVVVHRVNGQRMEKWYIIASCILSLCITIPPYAAGQYGWDVLVRDCWYSNDNQKQRLAWQIGSQLLWTLITVLGEVVCSLTVFIYMIRHQLKSRRAFSTDNSSTAVRSRSGSVSHSRKQRQLLHANKYRAVLLRIALYPVVSCIINLTSTICVLHATVTNGVHNMDQYHIELLSDFLYGARPVAYALLAASDPSLLSAIKALLRRNSHTSHTNTATSMRFNTVIDSSLSHPAPPQKNQDPMRVNIELSTIQHYDDASDVVPTTPGFSKPTTIGFSNLPNVGDHKHPLETANYHSQSFISTDHEAELADESMQIEEELLQEAFRRQI